MKTQYTVFELKNGRKNEIQSFDSWTEAETLRFDLENTGLVCEVEITYLDKTEQKQAGAR